MEIFTHTYSYSEIYDALQLYKCEEIILLIKILREQITSFLYTPTICRCMTFYSIPFHSSTIDDVQLNTI